MFHESEESEGTLSDNNGLSDAPVAPEPTVHDRINKLKRARQEDQLEEYREEFETSGTSKRKLSESDDEFVVEVPKKKTAAERMMEQMGYKEGLGLGKNKQGISEPVALSNHRGRIGLGSAAGKAVARDFNEEWDETKEEKTVEETVHWIPKCDDETREEVVENLKSDKWIVIRKKKDIIHDEVDFCDQKILTDMIEAKNVFDVMSDRDLREARARANPYETIGSAFFQNRAAMKTANMDRIYNWILSGENLQDFRFVKKNPLEPTATPENTDRDDDLFYFADVCAGPGGFSEYMLWRKGFYNAKGFGFTLAGRDDFKMNKFCASSAYYFEPYYGVKKNGDVMDPENIESLENFIMKGTNSLGVHLMMADGGFSVTGNENMQEVLSKRLYLCQLLVSLCIVREGGNFFCKLFDIFTPFSVALIYLMRVCYDEISLHKPHTSRPANSERYITCKGLRKKYSDVVRDYLKRINRQMDVLQNRKDDNDVMEIVPLDILKDDSTFFDSIVEHNHGLALRQTMYLRKYQSFAKNQGQYDKDQGKLRDDCLKYWMVPNRQKQREKNRRSLNAQELMGKYSPKMLGDSEYSIRPIVFDPLHLTTSLPSNIPYYEYRFVRLATHQQAMILVATEMSVYVNRNGRFESVEPVYARIPENTVLLIEEVKSVTKKDNGQLDKRNGASVYRILDAAVLNGDDVSMLRFEERMKAAEKFSRALSLVNKTVKKGWGNREEHLKPFVLKTAKVFSLDQLDELKEQTEAIRQRAETVPLFMEDDYHHECHGIRFVRIFKSDWFMGWSKSQQVPYAHSPDHVNMGSLFEENWARKNCFSSFWDTAVMTAKEKERLNDRIRKTSGGIGAAIPCMTWSWSPNLRNGYGPGNILNDSHCSHGPTIESLKQLIEKTDFDCRKTTVDYS